MAGIKYVLLVKPVLGVLRLLLGGITQSTQVEILKGTASTRSTDLEILSAYDEYLGVQIPQYS